MRASIDIVCMTTYRVFAGNCKFVLGAPHIVYLRKIRAKIAEIKAC